MSRRYLLVLLALSLALLAANLSPLVMITVVGFGARDAVINQFFARQIAGFAAPIVLLWAITLIVLVWKASRRPKPATEPNLPPADL